MTHALTFICETTYGAACVTACIDGVSLAELVAAYECDKGYDDPAGGYGGLIPSHFHEGPLRDYFLGRGGRANNQGKIYTLACECGDAGCWPLLAHVGVTEQTVTWSHFSQPHRLKRDYADFGPFEFDRRDYETAVAAAALFTDGTARA